jgi:crotonobetainyl-CoA:carnitine CoA-transferase CaiB-like acyl-CoA transferase
MSGFAAVTGEPDGPPTLPPFGLADGVAALTTAFGIMTALRARESTGRGQVLDMAIIEPLLTLLGPQIIAYDQLGELQPRTGNRSVNNAPRNTYRCADGQWVAVSTSAQSIAERVMHLVGRPDLVEQPWFASGVQRAEHADELDDAVGGWIAERDRDEVVAAFGKAQAAVAPIYTAADVLADPQFRALGSIVEIDDDELGPIKFQNVPFRLSETPGRVRSAGAPLGRHTAEVLARYGVDEERLAQLRAVGAV